MMFDFKMTRRAVVQAGLAAGALSLGSKAAAWSLANPMAGGRPTKLHKLLVDRSIPESLRLGTYAEVIADDVLEFDGDLTRLWVDEFRSQWPKGPRPIGGLTAPSARFVLEQLGRDHDARIVFSTEHRKVAGGVQHSLVGCDALLQFAEFHAETDWVAEMAKLILACPHQPTSQPTSIEHTSRAGVGMLGDRHRLVTWVLAPIYPFDQQYNSEKRIR